MYKKTLALLAVICALIAGLAIPASARGGLRGEMDLVLNAGLLQGGPTTDVNWIGPLDFGDDGEYDLVLFGVEPTTELGGGWVYFVHQWALFERHTVQFDDTGVVIDFDRSLAIVEGNLHGLGTPRGVGLAYGRVNSVNAGLDPFSLFDDDDVGGRIFFRGAFGDTDREFAGSFWISGLRGRR